MNLRLIVMRHAKSLAQSAHGSDHNRILHEKGIREAQEIAHRMKEMQWVPQCVLSSDATRTRQTWEAMREILGGEMTVEWLPEFYLAGINEAVKALETMPETQNPILVLGHNPGWEGVVQWLSGEHVTLTTANAVLLEHSPGSWRDSLEHRTWTLVKTLRPQGL